MSRNSQFGSSHTSFDVIAFHDDTSFSAGDKYCGHILLFAPINLMSNYSTPLFGSSSEAYEPIQVFIHKMKQLREGASVQRKLHFNEISGTMWVTSDSITRSIVSLTVDALRHKFSTEFPRPLCFKYAVLFFPSNVDLSRYGGRSRKEKKLRCDETILRMLLKGSLHYLYGDSSSVTVHGIVSDGDPYHRQLDDSRIIWKILLDDGEVRSELKAHAKFARGARILQLPSDHKNYSDDSEEYVYSNILQVADLLLGSTIKGCHISCQEYPREPRRGDPVSDKKGIVSYPVKHMLDKSSRGSGFENSGHYRSFSVSTVEFNDDGIVFRELSPSEFRIGVDSIQLPFDF